LGLRVQGFHPSERGPHDWVASRGGHLGSGLVEVLRFRVQDLRFRVQDSGLKM